MYCHIFGSYQKFFKSSVMFLEAQEGRSYEFMLVCPSVQLELVFLRICSLFLFWNFAQRLKSRNRNIIFSPTMCKKHLKLTQNGFFSHHKIFSLFFAGSNIKWKALQFSVFLCKLHIWENTALPVIVQNTLTRSDCRILWSSISLERMHGCP